MSQCPNCGAALVPNQLKCNKCGTPVQVVAAPNPAPAQGTPNAGPVQGVPNTGLVHPSTPPKSSTTALILSCLIVGLGQIYLGQTVKGVVMLVASMVLGAASGFLLTPVFWIVAMVDAHMIGNKLASGQPVRQWEFF